MKKKISDAPKADPSINSGRDLRLQAEAKLTQSKKGKAPAPRMAADALRLVHELEVHQIELEMQNEELVLLHVDLEAALHLYDLAPVGYFTLEDDGAIRQVNLVGADMLGISHGKLIKRRFGLFVAEESRPVFSAFLGRVFASAEKETCEVELLNGKAEPLWARIEAAAVASRETCHAIVSDVTERRLAEIYREMGREILRILNEPGNLHDAIQRILDVLQTCTESDAVGIRLQDGDDFPYFVQKGFSKDFLLTENSLVERGADGGVCRNKDGSVRLECTCGLVVSGKTDPANPLFTKGGSAWTNNSITLLDIPPSDDPRLHPRNKCVHKGYASVALVPILNKDKIVGLIQLNDKRKGRFTLATVELLEGIAGHIGAAMMRKQAESQREAALEALRVSEEKWHSLFEILPVGVSIVNSKNDMTEFNPALAQILDISEAGLLKGDYKDRKYLRPDKTPMSAEEFPSIRAVKEQKIIQNIEIGVEKENGVVIWTSVSAVPLSAGNGSVTVTADITERKRIEEEIQQLNATLEQRITERTRELLDAQEKIIRQEKLSVLGQMAGSVGHELRNPLGVISNAVYFLKMVQTDAPDKVKEYLNLIEKNINISTKIIADLLDLMRLKSAERKAVAVLPLVQQTLEHFSVPESVQVKIEIPADLPKIYADPQHVVQTLGNFTLNACQAMAAGGQLTISSRLQDQMICIAVRDTGAGILPENMKKLFEPLFTTKPKGIGLGLAICQNLVEANDGRIEVQSELGKGSTFSVWLPIQK